MKMRKTVLTLIILLVGMTTMLAQSTKEERIDYIHKVFAEAKQKVADNGKDGNPRLDMTFEVKKTTDADENSLLDVEKKTNYYYDKMRRYNAEGFFEEYSQCYFIEEEVKEQGNLRYIAMLFDPKDGSLLLSYNHNDATEFTPTFDEVIYYNEQGKVIERTIKEDNKEAPLEQYEILNGEGDIMLADQYLSVFNNIANPELKERNRPTGKVTPKAQRMQFIRDTYAKAKQKVERDDTSGKILITWHDQNDGDSPALTTEIKLYSDILYRDDSYVRHCYFISTRTRGDRVNSYEEYLFDPETDHLIFAFDQHANGGTKSEERAYFNEKGECIELLRKNLEEQADGFDFAKYATEEAHKYLDVFFEMIY